MMRRNYEDAFVEFLRKVVMGLSFLSDTNESLDTQLALRIVSDHYE